MTIPRLDTKGFLPAGIHDCDMGELRARFGEFQRTDRRPRLYERLVEFVEEAKNVGFVTQLIVDGSFVSGADEPNDIDLIVVLSAVHDLASDLRPFEYNIISKRAVRKKYQFDVLVAVEGTTVYQEYVEFFQQMRGQPNDRKGILRVRL